MLTDRDKFQKAVINRIEWHCFCLIRFDSGTTGAAGDDSGDPMSETFSVPCEWQSARSKDWNHINYDTRSSRTHYAI